MSIQASIINKDIKRIVIVGGGVTGWTVAAGIVNGLAGLNIEIVLLERSQQLQTDKYCEFTNPTCVGFHRQLGIDEQNLVAKTGAGFLLASRFDEWADKEQNYYLSFTEHGFMFNRIEFPQYFVSNYFASKEAAFGNYSLGAVAASLGRFRHPSTQESSIFATLEYGLNVNTFEYTTYLRNFAKDRGVKFILAEIDTVRLDQVTGAIEALALKNIDSATNSDLLDNGNQIFGDFFIDCTGEEALLIEKTLGSSFSNVSPIITHTLSYIESASMISLPVSRRLNTTNNGWQQQIYTQKHSETEYFFNAEYENVAQALKNVTTAAIPQSIQVKSVKHGRQSNFWIGNCLAIGSSAGCIYTFAASQLHTTQTAVIRFLSLFNRSKASTFTAREYNRLTNLEYDHIEDFHVLHYKLASGKKSEFWDFVLASPISQRLEYKLELFKYRGVIPFYEGETFSSGTWTSLLLGNNVWPKHFNPLIQDMDAKVISQQLEKMRTLIGSAANSMPSHSAYLKESHYFYKASNMN